MFFTMSNFDSNKYKSEYAKTHYTQCKILLKVEDEEILAKYSQITGENKSSLFKLCLKYCYENMIDITELKSANSDK